MGDHGDLTGPILVHRGDAIDRLKALHLTARQFDHVSSQDSYSCGYRSGYEDALRAVACGLGVPDALGEPAAQVILPAPSDY